MLQTNTNARQAAVSTMKQSLILDAARQIFEEYGIEGASIRAIAKKAGYTPGAIYFHFASKEEIYAALLDQSLDILVARVTASVVWAKTPKDQMYLSGRAFFDFYAENPRDLDLGFYLFRGGMRPHGLGSARDQDLNEKLLWSLTPFRHALMEMGCKDETADAETAAFFAHTSGLLLLKHTGRMSLFATDAAPQINSYLTNLEHRMDHMLAVAAWAETQKDL